MHVHSALRLFPNLLPSTFEEKHQKEEKRKKQLAGMSDEKAARAKGITARRIS